MSEQMFGERPAETAYERGHSDGEKFERERIIKLLQEQAWQDEFGDWIIHEDKQLLIALIKGEQK